MRRKPINKLLLAWVAVVTLFGSIHFALPAQAAGASLYLAPSTGTYVIGGRFSVAVRVNSGGDTINAAEGTISFDSNLLEVTGVSKSGSVFNLWTVEPVYNNSAGTISFGGGIPRPGYSGSSGGICTVSFRAKKSGTAAVRFTSGAVLAADGKGTNVLVSMGSGSYTISPQVTAPSTPSSPSQPSQPAPQAEPDYNKPAVKSETHPDQNTWYNKNIVKFSWELPEGVSDASVLFDRKPDSNPGSVSDGKISEKEYTDVEDGVWYFHIRYKDARRWGTTEHYRVMIDTRPPLPFDVNVKKIGVGEWPELSFETTDKESGLARYEVFIGSLEEKTYELGPEEKGLKVTDLGVGEHVAMIRALDNAGNEAVKTINFMIDPIPAPVITNYPEQIKSTDKFYASGYTEEGNRVEIFVEKDGEIVAQAETGVDNETNWFYIFEDGLGNGRYAAWAESVNDKGMRSYPSEKVTFVVSPPIFAVIGDFVINYFTVLVSLIFMIILIIIVTLILVDMIRKRLRKEAVEVEDVVRKNLHEYRKVFDEEMDEIVMHKKDLAQEKDAVKERMDARLEQMEKKIMKEIKDVEELLK